VWLWTAGIDSTFGYIRQATFDISMVHNVVPGNYQSHSHTSHEHALNWHCNRLVRQLLEQVQHAHGELKRQAMQAREPEAQPYQPRGQMMILLMVR
jgi:hypothetical protein